MDTMRVSSYIIPTQVDDDQYMLLHGYTGAIDIVGKEIGEFMQKHEGKDIEGHHPFTKETVSSLSDRGFLTAKSASEEIDYVSRLSTALHKKDSLMRASFSFIVTYDCNFRCPYCFEHNSVIKESPGRTMTKESVDCAFSAIEKINRNKITSNKVIVLFGGEPLLQENLHIVEYIVSEGNKRDYRFKAITNGYDLDSFYHLLGKDKIESIQVTIDGLADAHNSRRIHKKGIPTFDKIVENIRGALSRGTSVTVRFNTSIDIFNEMTGLLDYFRDIGLTSSELFQFSSARLLNAGSGEKCGNVFSPAAFLKEHARHNFKYSPNLYFSQTITQAINTHKPLPLHSNFCSAQTAGYVFDPHFRLYPCWEVIGDDRHRIGNYRNGNISLDKQVCSTWHIDASRDPVCKHCKYLFLCGGGCPARKIAGHQCTGFKEIIHHYIKQTYSSLNTHLEK